MRVGGERTRGSPRIAGERGRRGRGACRYLSWGLGRRPGSARRGPRCGPGWRLDGGGGCGHLPSPLRSLGYPPDRGSCHRPGVAAARPDRRARAPGRRDPVTEAGHRDRGYRVPANGPRQRALGARGPGARSIGPSRPVVQRSAHRRRPCACRFRPCRSPQRHHRHGRRGDRRERPSLVRTWIWRTRPGPHSAARRSSSLPWR